MDRSKIVAIITGAISLLLAIAYLILVQLLDMRSEMVPAPQSTGLQTIQIANVLPKSLELSNTLGVPLYAPLLNTH